MAKKCASCGQSNPDSNRFCEICGVKLVVAAPPAEVQTQLQNAITPTLTTVTAQEPSEPSADPTPAAPAAKESAKEKPKATSSKKQTATSTSRSFALPAAAPGSLMSFLTGEQWIYALLIVVGIFSRFYDLGYKPLHHDESIHALNSYTLFKGGGWKYDPGYHPPILYHLNALSYFLFGASDYTARIMPALLGVILIGLPYFMRDIMGRTAAIFLAVLFTLSPVILYDSRFIRHDIYLVWGVMIMVISYFRHQREAKPVYAYWFAFGLSFCFVSLESTYLQAAIFFPFLVGKFLYDNWNDLGKTVARYNQTFFKVARDEKKYLVWGLLLIGLILTWALIISPNWYTADAGDHSERFGVANDFDQYVKISDQKGKTEGLVYHVVLMLHNNHSLAYIVVIATVILLIVGPFLGTAWYTGSFRTSFFCYLIFYSLFVPLFTTFFPTGWGQLFGNPKGLFDGLVRSLTYWLWQQPVSRGDQPWHFYYDILLMYEQCAVIFTALGFIVFTMFKRTTFNTFLVYWVIGAFVAYVKSAEKMPWITIHMLLPMVVLSAQTIAYFWDHPLTLGGYRIMRTGLLLLLVPLLSLMVHNSILLAYFNPASPVEPMVYVQSTNDVKEMMGTIERLSNRLTGGKTMEITVEDLCSWPFAWYLRDYKNLDYPNPVTRNPTTRPIVLSAWNHGQPGGEEHDNAADKMLAPTYHAQKYRLRAWWDWNHPTDFDLGKYWRWLMYREPWSSLGSQDMIFWVKNDVWEQAQ